MTLWLISLSGYMRHKFDYARFFDLTSGCLQISDVYQA
ncbi:hypothetical protein EMIT0P176_360010 [Pseudomonas sp. IT-P176]